ncbi:MAG: serine/threonine protein kinase [Myxococcales bacterium]|nr:serine/threonine protein kinase [Myxococcales bacterium]
MNASECPDDLVLDEFVRGELDATTTRSIDAHMDRCPSCSELVGLLARSHRSDTHSGATLERGAEVGPYVLRSLLGEGASGLVYLAWDPRLEREVALKVLRPERARDPVQRERARREASALAKLTHENIVTVFDVGEADGQLYVAMEVVRGPTLRAWLDARSRPWREALAVVIAAGRGLAAAHARSVLHRDVKPENIVIGEDRVRLADFGLAAPTIPRGSLDEGALSHALTQTGALLGTPLYMAPETLDGAQATERSDLFSLGVVAYEALVGRRPFVAATLAELRASIAQGPSLRGSPVSAPVLRVIARALEANPERRPSSVAAWLAELDRASRASPRAAVLAVIATATVALSAGAWARTNRASHAPSVAACSAGARPLTRDARDAIERAFVREEPRVGAALARELNAALDRWADRWFAASEAVCRVGPTTAAPAPSPELRAAQRRCLDHARGDFDAVVASLARANRSVVLASSSIAFELPPIERCADTRALVATEAPPTDPSRAREVTRAEVLVRESISNMTTGHYRDASARAAEAERAADASQWAPVRSRASRALAKALRALGSHVEASRAARRAALVAEAGRDDDGAARAWLELVASEGARGAWSETIAAIDQAEASVRRVGDPALESSLALLNGLALSNLGHLDRATTALDRALALRAQHGGDRSPVLTALANVARERGELDRALALHREAMELDRARTGLDHPDRARHLHNIAGVLRRAERRAEAREHYLQALELEERWLGPRSIERGLELNSLGLLALEARSFDEAERRLLEAESILGATLDAPLATLNLALVALSRGAHSVAIERARRALARDTNTFGANHLRVARARKVLGLALVASGSTREGRAELEASRAIVASRTDAESIAVRDECERALASREAPSRPRAQPTAPTVTTTRSTALPDAHAIAPSSDAATERDAGTVAIAPALRDAGVATRTTPVSVAPQRYVPSGSGSGSYGPSQRWTP